MKTTLKDFLVTGTLGPVTLGFTKEQVEKSFGVIEYSEAEIDAEPTVTWIYDCLQFGFEDNNLILIGFYFRNCLGIPPEIDIEGYFPTEMTTLHEFRAYLDKEQIPYQLDLNFTFEPQLCLFIGKGIDAFFKIKTNNIDSLQFIGGKRLTNLVNLNEQNIKGKLNTKIVY